MAKIVEGSEEGGGKMGYVNMPEVIHTLSTSAAMSDSIHLESAQRFDKSNFLN